MMWRWLVLMMAAAWLFDTGILSQAPPMEDVQHRKRHQRLGPGFRPWWWERVRYRENWWNPNMISLDEPVVLFLPRHDVAVRPQFRGKFVTGRFGTAAPRNAAVTWLDQQVCFVLTPAQAVNGMSTFYMFGEAQSDLLIRRSDYEAMRHNMAARVCWILIGYRLGWRRWRLFWALCQSFREIPDEGWR